MPFHLYRSLGHQAYDGEPVSQLEHAAQTAELARALCPDDPEFALAAFLHDVGHLLLPTDAETERMGHYGVRNHEARGAQFLRSQGFSEKICRLVEGHVAAKRYLVSTDPDYFARLSPASKITLMHQGGMMTAEERADFEADSLFQQHLQLRRFDEQAKVAGGPVPDWAWVEQLADTMPH
jgi:2-amino-1-hydroxyethylphosphonate dioxygenase (glycine-forming)